MKFMNKNLIILLLLITSCATPDFTKKSDKKDKEYFASKGFALIFDNQLYLNKTINKKINNENIEVMHNFLKTGTPVEIVNPENSKSIKTKVKKRAQYPSFFNIVISNKIAFALQLDTDNPYVEFNEIKKNKTFVAKKSNTFDEEKNVADKAPVDEIKMDDLSNVQSASKNKSNRSKSFTIVIADFYYQETADNLKNELIKKNQFNNMYVKKINNNKYRLLVGPFENFNALKTTYISLNNLGFENLNVYRE